VDEHGLGVVEIIFEQVRVQPGVTCPSIRWNGLLGIAVEGSQKKLRRARDRPDAVPESPRDLLALKRLVAGKKIAASLPLSKITGRSRSTSPCHSEYPSTPTVIIRRIKAGVAEPPGIPALSLTSHSLFVNETSRIVCITAGAQWPILKILANARPR
jgi:hypothetical protein